MSVIKLKVTLNTTGYIWLYFERGGNEKKILELKSRSVDYVVSTEVEHGPYGQNIMMRGFEGAALTETQNVRIQNLSGFSLNVERENVTCLAEGEMMDLTFTSAGEKYYVLATEEKDRD